MYNIFISDETLDQNLSGSYALSINISDSMFSYCILDTLRNKFICLKNIDFGGKLPLRALGETVTGVLQGEELLNLKYKSIKALFTNNNATIVPEPLFNDKNKEDFFSINFIRENDEIVFDNKIKNLDARIIFGVPETLLNSIKNLNAKAYHCSVPFIYFNLLKFKNKLSTPAVFIDVKPDFFQILVLHDNKLILYNTFEYKNNKDFIYFVLYVFDQLKLNAEKSELRLWGFINKNDEKLNLLKKYIKNVRFAKKPDQFTYSYLFNDIPSNHFNNLISLENCE